MEAQRNTLSQMSASHWDTEIDVPRPLSSSLELHEPHLWISSPEQNLSESTVPKQPKESFLSKSQDNQSTKGCSNRSQILAFIVGICAVIITAVVLTVVLIYTLKQPVLTTSTTVVTITTTSTMTTTYTTTTTSDTSTTSSTSTTVTTTTTSDCGVGCSTTLSSSSSRIAYYKFDSTLNDVTGVYPATGINSPSYTTGYIGSAVSLDAPSYQRLITSPMDLYNKSFTIQLWFYLTRIATQDNAFFGQQGIPNVGGQCLFLMTHLGKLYMDFFNDYTTGSTILQNNNWYHAAFVYDNDNRQRFIYLNGVLDGQSATGVGPYLGTSGSMTIGSANVSGSFGTPYFSGYIDELMVFTRVKTACEILSDATLAAYFPFDGSYTDSGPNSLSLTSSGASFITGYTNQAVYLAGTSSYVQVGGLISLGRPNNSYSIAFWIYPIVKGVLVHISANSTGMGWCTPFLIFSSTGYIMTQVYDGSNTITITGPFIQFNTWTHIIETYSTTNGQRLYINGILYSSLSSSTKYAASQVTNYLTFGNMLSGTFCANPSTITTVYQGRLDELRVYSRELSSIDSCLLAQS